MKKTILPFTAVIDLPSNWPYDAVIEIFVYFKQTFPALIFNLGLSDSSSSGRVIIVTVPLHLSTLILLEVEKDLACRINVTL